MIKTSIRASMRPQRGSDVHPLKWAFEQASAMGFDGLELCTHAGRWGQFSTWMTPELRQGIKDLAREYKMSVFSLSADWAWEYAIFFPDYKDWKKGVEFMAADAQLAQELGAHTILLHFGDAKGTWDEAKALLRDVAQAGEQYGVRFGFEANIWANTTGFGGMDSLIRMVDEIGSPYFGIYLHNAWPRGQGRGGGFPLHEEIEMCGERLVQAMHSSSLVDGRVEIDWPKAFAAMKKYFPNGAYTFEVSWDTVAESKKVLDEMIAKYW